MPNSNISTNILIIGVAFIVLIWATIGVIEHLFKREKPINLYLFFSFNNLKFGGLNMDFKISIDKVPAEGIKFHIVPKDAEGKEVSVQAGTAQFQSSNESVATVAPDPDKDGGAIITVLSVGSTDITSSADADLTDGVTTVTGVGTFEFLPDMAKTLDIVVDNAVSE